MDGESFFLYVERKGNFAEWLAWSGFPDAHDTEMAWSVLQAG
ncbi:hypothetical protein SZ54_4297 [Rhizobium sp. UR51a]|nr:hypothetical protein SZ54_4297 [Rhizobium sp. UR51a]